MQMYDVATDWDKVHQRLEELYAAANGLEKLFPGRKFTLDGHLVGSIGEVIAAYMFDLELVTASTRAHDAVTRSGIRVEIKLTQGKRVALRHEPEHLIVLHRPAHGQTIVIYNGPGAPAWEASGTMGKNGQQSIGIAKLSVLNEAISEDLRIPENRKAPV